MYLRSHRGTLVLFYAPSFGAGRVWEVMILSPMVDFADAKWDAGWERAVTIILIDG